MQPALFDTTPFVVAPAKPDPHAGVDMDALRQLAFLYTATETGNHSGIRCMMSVEDAKAWCSSPVSRGRHYRVEWAFFWTSVANFVTCYWCGREPEIDISKEFDNGEWDERMANVGVTKISLDDIADTLRPLGVKVAR